MCHHDGEDQVELQDPREVLPEAKYAVETSVPAINKIPGQEVVPPEESRRASIPQQMAKSGRAAILGGSNREPAAKRRRRGASSSGTQLEDISLVDLSHLRSGIRRGGGG